jgi:hypothetical protein
VFYDFSFTIPANTPANTPEELACKLTNGIIHRVEIGFPKGCAGLVSLAIRRGLHQVWPTNPDGAFNTDNFTILINEHYPLLEVPYILTLVGWNLDDTYDHTLEVRFGILSEEIIMPEAIPTSAFKKLLKFFGI